MNNQFIVVEINNQPIKVSKLKLSKYAEVLGVLEQIPQLLGEMAGKTNDELFQTLPKLLAKALPEVIKLLAIATPLDGAAIDELGLDEATELLKAVIEVNKIGRVAENLKNLFSPKNSQPASGSTVPSTSSPLNTGGTNPKSSTSIPTNSTNSTP